MHYNAALVKCVTKYSGPSAIVSPQEVRLTFLFLPLQPQYFSLLISHSPFPLVKMPRAHSLHPKLLNSKSSSILQRTPRAKSHARPIVEIIIPRRSRPAPSITEIKTPEPQDIARSKPRIKAKSKNQGAMSDEADDEEFQPTFKDVKEVTGRLTDLDITVTC